MLLCTFHRSVHVLHPVASVYLLCVSTSPLGYLILPLPGATGHRLAVYQCTLHLQLAGRPVARLLLQMVQTNHTTPYPVYSALSGWDCVCHSGMYCLT